MSSFEIYKLLEDLDREYLSQAKTTDNIDRKQFCTKAHFVINRIKRELKQKFEDKTL